MCDLRIHSSSLKWFIVFTLSTTLIFFNKQLSSGLSHGFWGPKLFNCCSVVSTSDLCLRGIQWLSGFKSNIYDQRFWNFLKNAFETVALLVYCRFNSCFTFITKKKSPLFIKLQFVLLLSERGLSSESSIGFFHPRAICSNQPLIKNKCILQERTLKTLEWSFMTSMYN